MSIFSHADLANINQAVALQFAPNASEVVSLTVQHTTARKNLFAGVVADSTNPAAISYVPFVARASALAPGYSESTVVTLHSDKAAADLPTAVTNAAALVGTDADAQAPGPLGVIPADVGATV